MKLGNSSGQKNNRRIAVIERLMIQLEKGTKPEKIHELNVFPSVEIPLTEEDIKRIKKEVRTLEARTMDAQVARTLRTKKYRGAGAR